MSGRHIHQDELDAIARFNDLEINGKRLNNIEVKERSGVELSENTVARLREALDKGCKTIDDYYRAYQIHQYSPSRQAGKSNTAQADEVQVPVAVMTADEISALFEATLRKVIKPKFLQKEQAE